MREVNHHLDYFHFIHCHSKNACCIPTNLSRFPAIKSVFCRIYYVLFAPALLAVKFSTSHHMSKILKFSFLYGHVYSSCLLKPSNYFYTRSTRCVVSVYMFTFESILTSHKEVTKTRLLTKSYKG